MENETYEALISGMVDGNLDASMDENDKLSKQRTDYYQITKYRYAYLLSIFKQQGYQMNLYAHASINYLSEN